MFGAAHCATLNGSACVLPGPRGPGNPLNPIRARDWGLQLFPMNEEFLVSASHQLALITSLPFVHTRPSLLPIAPVNELFGLDPWAGFAAGSRCAEKMRKLTGVEVVKVVTRYP
ncbi:hypothetical protein DPMN_131363 [Dreissena polymorpha]|uniref:Uncharacterized protein n=1 Tax=Dreissena polymorpha TaxID=45954 RepID=A0A9D4HCS2_DREPO|nr:hypothetical protein DPMN_131363 [Dreissena polymorpha]